MFFRIWVVDVLVLGWCGGSPAEPKYIILGQFAAAYYFAHFLIILPIISRSERPRPLPNSITEAVLAGKGGQNPGRTAMTGSMVPAE
jgi:ubiquinol-cytochrome c reductase cytochrome b subunit